MTKGELHYIPGWQIRTSGYKEVWPVSQGTGTFYVHSNTAEALLGRTVEPAKALVFQDCGKDGEGRKVRRVLAQDIVASVAERLLTNRSLDFKARLPRKPRNTR